MPSVPANRSRLRTKNTIAMSIFKKMVGITALDLAFGAEAMVGIVSMELELLWICGDVC